MGHHQTTEGIAYCEAVFGLDSQPIDFEFVAVNEVFVHLTGGRDTRGKRLTEAFPEVSEQSPELLDAFLRVAATGQSEQLETYFGHPGRWLSAAVHSMERGGLIAVFEDNNERTTSEESFRDRAVRELAEAREQLQTIMDYSPAAIYVKDVSGRYVVVNRRHAELMGRPANEIIGRTVHDLFPPAVAEEIRRRELAILESGSAAEWEEVVSLPGGPAPFIANGFPLSGSIGTIEYVGYIYLDISERKRIEAEQHDVRQSLRASLERFVGLFRASPVPFVILDDATEAIVEVNEAFELTTGFRRDEAVGGTVEGLGFWTNLSEKAQLLSLLQQHGRVAPFEATLRKKTGETFAGLLSVELVDTHGGRLRILSVADITARKRAEASLIAARVSADRENEAKSEFVSRMSHELRTPLNVILGFAQVLRLDPLQSNQDEAVGHILTAGHHLLDLINDVLDLSRMESGRIKFAIERVSVADAIEDSLSLIQPLAAVRHITTQFIPDEPVEGLMAMSDRQRLKQVLLNLLSNAVKYNRDGGSVTVTCGLRAAGEVRIQVADTGPGISPQNLRLLFTPFERLDAEGTIAEGTGLGLALSKRFVEAMGGTIGATATLGEGTAFWVDLPLAANQERTDSPLAASEPRPQPTPHLRPATILYIEDNLGNLELVERVLARFRTVKLIPAVQGRIGLDLARQHRPDLVLLDLHLLDLSGEEVLRALKADPQTESVPVIIVSADASQGQSERLLASGAFAYITKPLDLRNFVDVIQRALEETDTNPRRTDS